MNGRRQPRPRRAGFTLLELLVVVGLIAAIAAIAFPMMSDEGALRLNAATDLLISDLEMAQTMSISDPANPIVMRFDVDHGRWWIAAADDTEVPLARADNGDPMLVELGSDRAASAAGVTFTLDDVDGHALAWDAHGSVGNPGDDPRILLEHDGRVVTIAIAPVTGRIVVE